MAECIRIYANGDFRRSHWAGKDLQDWIEYNKLYRFGNAVVVDRQIVANGYLTEEEIKQRLSAIPVESKYSFDRTKVKIFDS